MTTPLTIYRFGLCGNSANESIGKHRFRTKKHQKVNKSSQKTTPNRFGYWRPWVRILSAERVKQACKRQATVYSNRKSRHFDQDRPMAVFFVWSKQVNSNPRVLRRLENIVVLRRLAYPPLRQKRTGVFYPFFLSHDCFIAIILSIIWHLFINRSTVRH